MYAVAAAAPCCSNAIDFTRGNITGPVQSMPLVLINLLSKGLIVLLKMFSPDKEVAAVIRPSVKGVCSI